MSRPVQDQQFGAGHRVTQRLAVGEREHRVAVAVHHQRGHVEITGDREPQESAIAQVSWPTGMPKAKLSRPLLMCCVGTRAVLMVTTVLGGR
jgi:hypothetical protein